MASANSTPTKSTPMLKRAAASAYLGSVIEYYDFFVYSVCAALVFKDVFFSNLTPAVGTLASLATFATGYLARPLGGIIFGHFGDKLGRKRMLVVSMFAIGIASTAIGLLPTYDQAGLIAPVLLILIRVIQGVAIGGEWGGAMLMSAEHATKNRGFWASFTSAGAPTGQLVSALVIAGTLAAMGPDTFIAWGWRLPFLASVLLLIIGVIVRSAVDESPEFLAAKKRTPKRGIPIIATLRKQPLTLVLAVGVGLSAFMFQGLLTTYSIAYGVQIGIERQTILNALSFSSFFAIFGIIGWSRLSDTVGRRPSSSPEPCSSPSGASHSSPCWRRRTDSIITIGMVIGQGIIHPMIYGPLAGLYSELFDTEHRYTGASLGYQIAGIGAGISPVLFAAIMSSTESASTIPLSIVLLAVAAISILCIWRLGETKSRTLSEQHFAETPGVTHTPSTNTTPPAAMEGPTL